MPLVLWLDIMSKRRFDKFKFDFFDNDNIQTVHLESSWNQSSCIYMVIGLKGWMSYISVNILPIKSTCLSKQIIFLIWPNFEVLKTTWTVAFYTKSNVKWETFYSHVILYSFSLPIHSQYSLTAKDELWLTGLYCFWLCVRNGLTPHQRNCWPQTSFRLVGSGISILRG